MYKIKLLTTGLLLLGMVGIAISQQNPTHKKRLKRADSYLGVHFDFHAQDNATEIGKTVDRDMVEAIISAIRPDYVQCDGKGHRGLSSYPTHVGNKAPGFVRDPLKIWREVTAEHGVALYIHFSGIFDEEAARRHPEWALVNADGTTDGKILSAHGPYSDELLIPQLKEISRDYGVDGVWIDGDWAAKHDYSEPALAAFRKETGITTVPRKPDDPFWQEFTTFNRNSVKRFINHYISELHNFNPGFQITSNWVDGYKMPGMSDVEVDYLSADFNCGDSVNDARIAGRFFVHRGKPWDIMAWSFPLTGDDLSEDAPLILKTATQLKQEAAVALSLGGGFEVYFRQKKDGSINRWHIESMKEVAQFCRDRQDFCFGAEPIPQIGLIFSTDTFYRNLESLFSMWGTQQRKPFRGILNSLLDSGNVVDIIMDKTMLTRMKRYPLLIYPEWNKIDPSLKQALLAYVKGGGNLLLIGPKSAGLFEEELNVQLMGDAESRINGLEYKGEMTAVKSLSQKAVPGNDVMSIGKLYSTSDILGHGDAAATIHQYGIGKIAAIYLNLGRQYVYSSTTTSRDFLDAVIRELFPEPLVKVEDARDVDVSVNRLKGKLMINLVNTGGDHGNERVKTFDSIPPIGPLNITVRTGKKPESVQREPGGEKLDFMYHDGVVSLTYPRLEIHDILVVE
ncbi:hypothetical protein ACFL47_05860 [Candidatus Latescibacterota bacterium]